MASRSKASNDEAANVADIPITLCFEVREEGDPAERSAPVSCPAMNLMTVYNSMLAGIGYDEKMPLRVTMTIGGQDVTMESDDALELLAKLQHYILAWSKRKKE